MSQSYELETDADISWPEGVNPEDWRNLPDVDGDDESLDNDESLPCPQYVEDILGFNPDDEDWDDVTENQTSNADSPAWYELIPGVENAFCPTGKGGGVDPTCGKGGKGGGKYTGHDLYLLDIIENDSSIWNSKKETLVICQTDGMSYSARSSSSDREVVLDLSEKGYKNAKGSITTHNHPSGASFSRADIDFIQLLDQQEAHVFGVSGGVAYKYVLKRPDSGWTQFKELIEKDMNWPTKESPESKEKLHMDLARIAEKAGVDYSRNRVDKFSRK